MATNNSSSSTNNGSPLSTDQQLYPGNSQSSVGGGHSDVVNGDEQHPTPKNNYSPPLKSTPSSAVDMLAATHSHHPGHSIFESYNMTNGHNQNIHQNPVAKKGKCCQTFSLWNSFFWRPWEGSTFSNFLELEVITWDSTLENFKSFEST